MYQIVKHVIGTMYNLHKVAWIFQLSDCSDAI